MHLGRLGVEGRILADCLSWHIVFDPRIVSEKGIYASASRTREYASAAIVHLDERLNIGSASRCTNEGWESKIARCLGLCYVVNYRDPRTSGQF